MDIVDLVEAQSEQAFLATIAKIRKAANEPLPQTAGFCWFCGEAVAAPRRWCSAECRDLWERRKKA